MNEYVHMLGKEARTKIIRVLARKRALHTLARELRISPTAVHKFIRKKTHPSDKTIIRAIEIADDAEKNDIYTIIITDLLQALSKALRDASPLLSQHYKKIIRLQLKVLMKYT